MRAAATAVAMGLTVVGSGAVGGCSGSNDTGAPGTAAPQHASQIVGSSGGAVTTSSGAGVSIPAGALPGDVNVTVDSTPDAPPPAGGRAVGTPYTFGPEGTQFKVPVTITLDFDPSLLPPGKAAKDIYVFTAPAGTTDFAPLPTSVVDATHVSAPTTHFSVFVTFVPSAPPVIVTPPDAGTEQDAGAIDQDTGTGAPDTGPVDQDSGPIDQPDATSGGADASQGAPDAGDMDSSVPLPDATVGSDDAGATATDAGSGGGGGDGGSSAPDAGLPPPDDGGVAVDAGTDAGGDGGTTFAVCTQPVLQHMMTAPISPPSFAAIDWSSTSIDAAQAMTCAGTPTAPTQSQSDQALAWGASGDVFVEFGASRMASFVQVRGAYAGQLTLFSRKSGAYGNHTYVLALGSITKDAAAFDLQWVAGPDAAVTELYDAWLATFLPQHAPAPSDCVVSKECLATENDGAGNSVFGFRTTPQDVYVTAAMDTTNVNGFYSFIQTSTATSDASAPAPDASSCPPLTCGPGSCGMIGDKCGQTLDCGPCDGSSGGATDATISGDGSTCVPIPPQQACANVCGGTSDGCGGKYNCPCDGGSSGGTDAGSCVPMTSCPPGMCGVIDNGCGQPLQCASCPAGEVCGAGGPNMCGASDGGSSCVPIPMQQACAGVCGPTKDGCGGLYDCPCDGGTGGSGGGDAGSCVPMTQCPPGMCGVIDNGCGQPLQCPGCPSGETCGAGGPNMCGTAPDGGGTGTTCAADSSLTGSCANPPQPLCSAYPGTTLSGCTDTQGGGYTAKCCSSSPPPSDAGPAPDSGTGSTCYADGSPTGSCANPPQPLCSAYPGTTLSGCTDNPGGGYTAKCCGP